MQERVTHPPPRALVATGAPGRSPAAAGRRGHRPHGPGGGPAATAPAWGAHHGVALGRHRPTSWRPHCWRRTLAREARGAPAVGGGPAQVTSVPQRIDRSVAVAIMAAGWRRKVRAGGMPQQGPWRAAPAPSAVGAHSRPLKPGTCRFQVIKALTIHLLKKTRRRSHTAKRSRPRSSARIEQRTPEPTKGDSARRAVSQ